MEIVPVVVDVDVVVVMVNHIVVDEVL